MFISLLVDFRSSIMFYLFKFNMRIFTSRAIVFVVVIIVIMIVVVCCAHLVRGPGHGGVCVHIYSASPAITVRVARMCWRIRVANSRGSIDFQNGRSGDGYTDDRGRYGPRSERAISSPPEKYPLSAHARISVVENGPRTAPWGSLYHHTFLSITRTPAAAETAAAATGVASGKSPVEEPVDAPAATDAPFCQDGTNSGASVLNVPARRESLPASDNATDRSLSTAMGSVNGLPGTNSWAAAENAGLENVVPGVE